LSTTTSGCRVAGGWHRVLVDVADQETAIIRLRELLEEAWIIAWELHRRRDPLVAGYPPPDWLTSDKSPALAWGSCRGLRHAAPTARGPTEHRIRHANWSRTSNGPRRRCGGSETKPGCGPGRVSMACPRSPLTRRCGSLRPPCQQTPPSLSANSDRGADGWSGRCPTGHAGTVDPSTKAATAFQEPVKPRPARSPVPPVTRSDLKRRSRPRAPRTA
jgi:hypothetical protein